MLSNKQSMEEVLIRRAVETTIQIFYDKGLFVSFPSSREVSKDFLFIEKGRPDLEKVNDVIQAIYFKIQLEKATSNTKIQQILSSLFWSDVVI